MGFRATRQRLVGCMVSLLIALPAVGQCGLGVWGPLGPRAGRVSDVAVDPSSGTVYAAIQYRVYKSLDGGASWALSSSGLPANVSVVVVDPIVSSRLYAVAYNYGVFKSEDGATTWAASNTGLPNPLVSAIAVDPSTSGTVYVSLDGAGVFRSTDAGATWTENNGDLPTRYVRALAVDPVTPSTLYAGLLAWDTAPEALFRSTDGGAHWSALGLRAASTGGSALLVFQIVVDPTAPATIYALTAPSVNFDFGTSISKTSDGGATWTTAGLGDPSTRPFDLALDPASPSTLYAAADGGIYKSVDGAVSWTRKNVGIGALRDFVFFTVAVDPSRPSTVYAGHLSALGGGEGIFRSTDGGAHWTTGNDGLSLVGSVDVLGIDPDATSTLYIALYRRGLFASVNAGASWAPANADLEHLDPDRNITAIAIDPLTPSTVYLGIFGAGVYKTTDWRTGWVARNNGLPPGNLAVSALAMDPAVPSTLYAAVSYSGVFKTVDGGGVWTASNTGLTNVDVGAVTVAPSMPATLFAGSAAGVFKSVDAAGSWAITGLVPLPGAQMTVDALVVDPFDAATVYAGFLNVFHIPFDPYLITDPNLYRSTDGGATWTSIRSGLGGDRYTALAIDPETPETIYVATDGAGIFRSANRGATWTRFNTGLASDESGKALAIDPRRPSRIYAGTRRDVFEIEGPCATDADCADGEPCTDDHCDGSSGACANSAHPDGAPCDDADACTAMDACSGGICMGVPSAPSCDDGNPCTLDACDPVTGGCSHPVQGDGGSCNDGSACTSGDTCAAGICTGSPIACGPCRACDPTAGCMVALRSGCQPSRSGGSRLAIKNRSRDTADLLAWRWTSSAPTAKSDFGNPQTGTGYEICVWEERAGIPTAKFGLTLPSDICPAPACWSETAAGFAYDHAAPDGRFSLALKDLGQGRARIGFKGKGALLRAPVLPLAQDPAVLVQIGRTDGPACWEATYLTSQRNSSSQFKARAD